jgi:hypothetical protein
MRPIPIRKEVPLFILGIALFCYVVPPKYFNGRVSAVISKQSHVLGTTIVAKEEEALAPSTANSK